MCKENYHLGLFTTTSWREFLRHGASVMGFSEKRMPSASRLQTGDRILCYLSGYSAFVGVLEVTGSAFHDSLPIWSDGIFPSRIPVKIILQVPLESSVRIQSLGGQLSFLKKGHRGSGWTIHVRSSPRKWLQEDGQVVVRALREVQSAANLEERRDSHPPKNERVTKQLPPSTRVGRLSRRTSGDEYDRLSEQLGFEESVLSFNKVTGYSVNFPIAPTCRPTAVCMKTCYYAVGPTSWSNSVKHQYRAYNSVRNNPADFARRVAVEYDRLRLSFIRWNGGGDLFAENVEAINTLARIRPDIVIWVVTRLPEWASKLEQAENLFIHFSLDQYSLNRMSDFLRRHRLSENYFFSYQADKGEIPSFENLKHVSVLFFDTYKPTTDLQPYPADIICPLNTVKDISNVCEGCRRCFNGNAVSHRKMIRN